MDKYDKRNQEAKKAKILKTFPIPFTVDEIKSNINISTNPSIQTSQEKLIKQAFIKHLQGRISEAAKDYELIIEHNTQNPRIFSNYAIILR